MSLFSGIFPLLPLPYLDGVRQLWLHSTFLVVQVVVGMYAIILHPRKCDRDREYLLVGWSVNCSGIFDDSNILDLGTSTSFVS